MSIPIELKNKTVLVVGRSGFLGCHLSRVLEEKYGAVVVGRTSRVFDREEAVSERDRRRLDFTSPDNIETCFRLVADGLGGVDYCFHVAGWNGGILLNATEQWRIFHDNTLMGLNVLDACRRHGVKKVVSVVASCAYPAEQWHEIERPTYDMFEMRRLGERETCPEGEFLDGLPHPSVACHAYAKRNLQLASHFLNQQYGLRAVTVCPTTLFGEGDNFDPERTKVVGGLVKRFADAARSGQQEVECWGTGTPKREVLYVKDAAELLVQTMLHYEDSSQPLNLGSGQEHTVKELAEKVAASVQYGGAIRWDTSKPDGQMRKRLDLTRMQATLPPFTPTPLDIGLARTAADYLRRTYDR